MAERLLSIELDELTAWFEACLTGADEFTAASAATFARRLAAATERARLMEAAVVFLDARGGGPIVPPRAIPPDAGLPHAGGRRAHVIPIGERPAGATTDAAARKAPAWTPRLIDGGIGGGTP